MAKHGLLQLLNLGHGVLIHSGPAKRQDSTGPFSPAEEKIECTKLTKPQSTDRGSARRLSSTQWFTLNASCRYRRLGNAWSYTATNIAMSGGRIIKNGADIQPQNNFNSVHENWIQSPIPYQNAPFYRPAVIRWIKVDFKCFYRARSFTAMIKNLNQVDLFTLNVLIELYEHKNGTVVAKRLQATQPKVSRALATLREVFQDELFVRRQYGMEPNEIADKIYPVAKSILSEYAALNAIRNSDNAPANEVNIAVQDHACRLLMDSLRQSQTELGQNLSYHLHEWTTEVEKKLCLGQLDYCISINATPCDNVNMHLLSKAQQLYLVAKRGHPIFDQTLSATTIFSQQVALFNYATSSGRANLLESVAEKFKLSIKSTIKTSNIELLLDHLSQSNDISILGSVLSLELIRAREDLEYVNIFELWTREMNQTIPYYYLLSHKSADPALTASLVKNIKARISSLQEKNRT